MSGKWLKVEKLIRGSDGIVRGATVKLAKSGNMINRPINKLYPLLPSTNDIVNSKDVRTEITDTRPKRNNKANEQDDANEQIIKSKDSRTVVNNTRPKRNAAKLGENKRRLGSRFQ